MKNILLLISFLLLCCLSCNTEKTVSKETTIPSPPLPTPSPVKETTTELKSTPQIPTTTPIPIPEFECSQVQEDTLRNLEFGILEQLTMYRWLYDESSFKGTSIEWSNTIDVYEGASALIWKGNKGLYQAKFWKNTLRAVDIQWSYDGQPRLKPTASDIIDCFGEPDAFHAIIDADYKDRFLELGLWYLEDGIVVRSKALYGHGYTGELPSALRFIPMGSMSITPPGTKEDILNNVYPDDDVYTIEANKEFLETVRPWPGSWEEASLTGCIGVTDCQIEASSE